MIEWNKFLQAVKKEIRLLKEHCIKEELSKLDNALLNPTCRATCYYGQITGDCHFSRARELKEQCFTGIGFTSCDLSKVAEPNKNELVLLKYHFTPLEVLGYVIYTNDLSNKTLYKITDYLKGESNDLSFIDEIKEIK